MTGFNMSRTDLEKKEIRKIDNKKDKRNKEIRYRVRNFIISAAVIFSIMILIVSQKNNFVNDAEAHADIEKYYTSIEIMPGDTLWGIAERYSESYCSIKDYIAEVKSANNLNSDDITAGGYLVIPVYR